MSRTVASFQRSIRTAIAACTLVVGIASTCFAQAAAPPAGPDEAIKVHGDWVIVVKNPDGTVAARHEFQNALVPNGATLLTQLLAQDTTSGEWLVSLASAGQQCNPITNFACVITQGRSNRQGVNSTDLTATVPTAGANAGKLVLRGTVRVPQDTVFNLVLTQLATCAPSLDAPACIAANHATFSSRTLNPTVPVVTDQIVDVTVVISFS